MRASFHGPTVTALQALGPDCGGALGAELLEAARRRRARGRDAGCSVLGWWLLARLTLQSMPRAIKLVGRQRELAALRDAIASAAGGDGGLFLVAGEGGVGKTALVESALAENGELVLRGAADQQVVRPYAPVVAALRGYQRAVPDGLAVSGPLSEHLALILPSLVHLPPTPIR